MGRSTRENEAYAEIFYPGTEVLVNKLNIRDPIKLSEAERFYTDTRLLQGLPPKVDPRTYEGFKAIHHHMFQDLYSWAGQERKYTTGRGPSPFAVPEQIGNWMEKQFSELRANNYLRGMDAATFSTKAAELVNEINAAHPFIEGNGRTQRIWLREIAHQAGYKLQLTSQDKQLWYDASKIGFEKADYRPMSRLIQCNLSRLPAGPEREQPKRARARDDDRGPSR